MRVEIECLYTICGNADIYTELLPEGVTLRRAHTIGESVAALYGGSVCHDGFVALSGTGSDVFCIRNAPRPLFVGWVSCPNLILSPMDAEMCV